MPVMTLSREPRDWACRVLRDDAGRGREVPGCVEQCRL